ncbi:hypothetical protein BX666DRAFT_913555 [Dichotomocladium elegans]|nr:hypothetical protein BX666DRAFT_913555 [Dichotomocladium elegans]
MLYCFPCPPVSPRTNVDQDIIQISRASIECNISSYYYPLSSKMFPFLKTFVILLVTGLTIAQEIRVKPNNSTGDIVYPTEDTVWRVGEYVNVTFRPTVPPKETVAIFFANERNITLGGGDLTNLVFPFIVPVGALSPPNGKSLLLAIRRSHTYLASVDGVSVKVVY